MRHRIRRVGLGGPAVAFKGLGRAVPGCVNTADGDVRLGGPSGCGAAALATAPAAERLGQVAEECHRPEVNVDAQLLGVFWRRRRAVVTGGGRDPGKAYENEGGDPRHPGARRAATPAQPAAASCPGAGRRAPGSLRNAQDAAGVAGAAGEM